MKTLMKELTEELITRENSQVNVQTAEERYAELKRCAQIAIVEWREDVAYWLNEMARNMQYTQAWLDESAELLAEWYDDEDGMKYE